MFILFDSYFWIHESQWGKEGEGGGNTFDVVLCFVGAIGGKAIQQLLVMFPQDSLLIFVASSPSLCSGTRTAELDHRLPKVSASEEMIVCVAVVGHQNNPLYIQSFTEADDALKLHHIVHCSLDVIDERVNNPKKSGPMLNETFLGLLYPTENYKVYGYLTNTKVKFILVTTDLDVRDADVRNFFRKFHAAYVDAVSNPFHVPGKKITSRTFAERVSNIVKSFGLGSSG
ncbi:uncharacterized protein [Spinacia oleracea]|uniref:Trafficking protein particle complex subunit 2-like protein n=1 Tax=Spinacia oleracea TaxID=3562 RepID=A0A9R0J4P0_SPIOL|nr:uncharacterized protein LOC110800179 isoform X2 [Spinacia oleracea]